MANQIDFLAPLERARKRVADVKKMVETTEGEMKLAAKNNMPTAAKRLSGQLQRQRTALAVAEAELKEWESVK